MFKSIETLTPPAQSHLECGQGSVLEDFLVLVTPCNWEDIGACLSAVFFWLGISGTDEQALENPGFLLSR